ncbi:phosphocholine cytidylyltransferase family protein [Rhodospirillales bacterium]|nr:phosphocholine cytidylyltransferase family protein [Rhodospirillales bacterium]
MPDETKVIIIAAGMGNRLNPLTGNTPKCMLDFAGKTLLQRQLDAYIACGISDFALIRGFMKEKINYSGIRYYENSDYKNNNILASLFYAKQEIQGHVIVSYSDILFENRIVEQLLQSDADISIVVDTDWRKYYVGRKDHPIEEAENVILDDEDNAIEIGKNLTNKSEASGEYIGMLKFSPKGAEIFKNHYERAQERFAGKPFQRAQLFEKAYLTDLIQEMIDSGIKIKCVTVEQGWKEIDTVEDYTKAVAALDA